MNDQFCLKASQIPMRSSVVQEFLRIVAQMWWNRFWDSFLDFHFPWDETSIKFEFSEKATKFDKIFFVRMTRASCSVLATAYLWKSRQRFFFKCGQVGLYKLYIPWLTPSESMKISCVLVTPCFPRCAQVSGGFDTWISSICCFRKLISSVLSASFCLSSWISKACCFSFPIMRS